ncbi:NYN domain-containing protein [Myxococcota bacterium]|nr:NYN domain-containing protein [Myxococcota bacterium]
MSQPPPELPELSPWSRDVAVFVDAENATWMAGEALADLLERVADYGAVRHRRAYADWRAVGSPAFLGDLTRYGFELVQTFLPVKGKNSADIQIAVDVMDHLSRFPAVGCVVLVTGDSDFTPVFRRLRERSVHAVGCGPRSVLSEVVMHHCTQFIYADSLVRSRARPAAGNGAHQRAAARRAIEGRLDARELLLKAIAGVDREVNPATIKQRLLAANPAFDERDYGFRAFNAFLKAHPDLVALRVDEHGTSHVRSVVEAGAGDPGNGNGGGPGGPAAEPADPVQQALRVLRKAGWRPVEADVLLGARRAILDLEQDRAWPALVEHLRDRLGDRHTDTELRKAMVLLRRARLLHSSGSSPEGEPLWRAEDGVSDAQALDRIDAAMAARARSGLARTGQELSRSTLELLVVGPADEERLERLLEEGVDEADEDTAEVERSAALGALPPAGAPLPTLPELRAALAAAVADLAVPTAPTVLLERIRLRLPGFQPRAQGYRGFVDFVAAHPDLATVTYNSHGTAFVQAARRD